MAESPLLPDIGEEEGGEPIVVSDVEASAAAEFLGTWTLPLESPQGTFNIGLEFSEGDDGMLAAAVNPPTSPPEDAASIRRSDDGLVLEFTLTAFGSSIPATITLTSADEANTMNAVVDLAGFSLSGTATKEGG